MYVRFSLGQKYWMYNLQQHLVIALSFFPISSTAPLVGQNQPWLVYHILLWIQSSLWYHSDPSLANRGYAYMVLTLGNAERSKDNNKYGSSIFLKTYQTFSYSCHYLVPEVNLPLNLSQLLLKPFRFPSSKTSLNLLLLSSSSSRLL